jgi:SAM-dependent methyltransferase
MLASWHGVLREPRVGIAGTSADEGNSDAIIETPRGRRLARARAAVVRSFGAGWTLLHLGHDVVDRHGPPKALWEVGLEKVAWATSVGIAVTPDLTQVDPATRMDSGTHDSRRTRASSRLRGRVELRKDLPSLLRMLAGCAAKAAPRPATEALRRNERGRCNAAVASRRLMHGLPILAESTPIGGGPMNPNKALWEKGDFTAIAALMRESGEALVSSLGVTPTMRVLDVGCGDGTTALPLARAGADVVGIDIARNLVEAGNQRAAAAGLPRLKFQEGDACNLAGVPDHSVDLTLSMFGVMFAPKPFDVAKELVRVTRPGGRIVMGNWIPNDPTSFVSQLLRISSAFSPPPPEGFVSPMTWGVESHIVERFGEAGVPKGRVSMVKDTYLFASPDVAPTQFVDLLRRFYGPTMNAFDAAEKNGKADELLKQLVELANAENRGGTGTSIPATFMRVTVFR